MFDQQGFSLRERLRSECREVHDRLDADVGAVDPTTRPGLARILAMNALAFRALARAGARGEVVDTSLLESLAATAEADLATLGVPMPGLPQPARGTHPLAVDYVVLGSRAGTTLLRRRWQAATEPMVLSASRYLTGDTHAPLWRKTCDRLRDQAPDDAEADSVVTDTIALFDLFHAAFRATAERPIHA